MISLRKLYAHRLAAAATRRPKPDRSRLCLQALESREAPAADLRIDIVAAPNFVVDSNLKAGPTAAYLGARITNTGATPLTNAVFYAGDYRGGVGDTPGLYPAEANPQYAGNLSLTHEGGRADAVRYLGTLAPGQSVMQYWLVSYPWFDANGQPTYGAGGVNNADDLSLDYDVWATADGVAPTAATGTATLRNEISALANKIWPNTTSKVPDQYLDAFQRQLGWRPDPSNPEANTRLEGVWYDMGRVGQGFDADRNGTPDYDVWMQPVGDPDAYDAGSWRLTKAYGVLVVKLNDGTEQVIAFVDRLYFKDLPANNTGVVGLVFYQFVQTGDGAGALSPYQEAASGSDNEKFNGDYGASVGAPVTLNPPQVSIDKAGPAAVAPGASAEYVLTATNAGRGGYGQPAVGLPAVISDAIPAGTAYVANSAVVDAMPPGVTATVLYSTNGGLTWTAAQPADPATVTNLQWWLSGPLPAGASATVKFRVAVPANYPGAQVMNVGGLGLGNTARYTDGVTTDVLGQFQVTGLVFRDDGAGGVTAGDGSRTGTEGPLGNIDVSLHADANGNGVVDGGDLLRATASSAPSTGAFAFTGLRPGKYIVTVRPDDPDRPTGYVLSTAGSAAVTIATADVAGVEFGLSPTLAVTKRVVGNGTVNAGEQVSYTLSVTDLLKPAGYAPAPSYVGNVYWTDTTAGFHRQPPGAGAAPTDVTIGSPAPTATPFDVAVNTAAGRLYAVYTTGTLVQASLDGTNPVVLFTGTGSGSAAGVVVDPVNGYVYWTVDAGNTAASGVYRANLDGSNRTQIVVNAPAQAVAIDPVDGHVFWAERTAGSLRIKKALIGGGAAITVFDNATPGISGNSNPIDLEVDPVRRRLYFTDQKSGNREYIGTLNYDGTGFASLTGAALNATTPTGLAVDFAAGAMYWGQTSGTTPGIYQASVNFNSLTTLSGTLFRAVASVMAVEVQGAPAAADPGTYDPNKTLAAVRLRDTFDATRFTFVSASVMPDHVTVAGGVGTITWNNVGPINPAAARTITVTFQATAAGANVLNTVTADNAALANGLPANTGTAMAQTTVASVATNAYFGTVWQDVNGNGARDLATDYGIKGVGVELRNASDALVAAAATNPDGSYTFADVATSGTGYYVQVVPSSLPSGRTWAQTFDTDGTLNGRLDAPVPAPGGAVRGAYDFGYRGLTAGTGTIGDQVFYDWNGNNGVDPADEPIAGARVLLYQDANQNGMLDYGIDQLLATAATNAGGVYVFTALAAGRYLAAVDTSAAGFPAAVTPSAGNVTAVTLPAGQGVTTADFGYRPAGAGALGGGVWYDQNGNQVRLGAVETGLPNVTVRLLADLNGDGTFVQVAATSTDANGSYVFPGLKDGSYRVVVDAADTDLPADPGGNRYLPTTATAFTRTLTGGVAPAADFGFANLGSVGDTIFYDANRNGTQDWAERGIPNVQVWLKDPATSAVVATATTDANGRYVIAGVAPGTYYVEVNAATLPAAALRSTTPTADPDRDGVPSWDATYPGLPPADNRAENVRVGFGVDYAGADFGYEPKGVAGDYVWRDLDADGAQDAGEIGLGGLTVTATDGASTLTTATDPDGAYFFQGLTAGTWTISVTAPEFTPTAGTPADVQGGRGSVGATATVVVEADGRVTSINGAAVADGGLNIDFGLTRPGTLAAAGTVVLERTGTVNGLAGDPTDRPLAGLAVFLSEDVGGVLTHLGSTTTDANGRYRFANLPAGTYRIAVATGIAALQNTELTTDTTQPAPNFAGAAGATAYRTVPLSAATASGDGGTDPAAFERRDFAFASTVHYDFGDLPDSYATGVMADGARHILTDPQTLYLGAAAPDAEPDGLPTAAADGDGAEDDGVVVLNPAGWADGPTGNQIQVTVTGGGWLVGWMDFDRDGTFLDASELVVNQAVTTGTHTLNVTVPAGTLAGGGAVLYARFRLFEAPPIVPQTAFLGSATGGEVEDYRFVVGPTPVSDLRIDKSDDSPTVVPGREVTYTIVVTNDGPAAVTGALVSDALPAALSNVTWRITGSTGAGSGAAGASSGTGPLANVPVNLAAGGAVTFAVTGTLDPGFTGTLSNTARVDPPAGTVDPTPGNNEATDTSTAAPQTDLSLTKTVDTTTPRVGGRVTFTVTVHNGGPSAAPGVSVTDLLPGGLTYVSHAATEGTFNPTTGLWTGVDLGGAGDSATLTVVADVLPTGAYTNYAQVSAAPPTDTDSAAGNGTSPTPVEDDEAAVTLTPTPIADLSLTKVADRLTTPVGSAVTFTLTVSNTGPSAATGVAVTDLLPSGFAYTGHAGGTFDAASGVWAVGNLASGASATLRITATVLATGSYTNFAQVTASDALDPTSTPNNRSGTTPVEDDEAAITLTPRADADLRVAKTDGGATVAPGGTVTYTIIVTNDGPAASGAITLTDTLPANTFFDSASHGGSHSSGVVTWALPALASGASTQVTVTVRLPSTVPAGLHELSNSATATGTAPDPNGSNNTGTDTTPVGAAPDLRVSKGDGGVSAVPGGTVAYLITYRNAGTQHATGVTLTETLPANTTYNPAGSTPGWVDVGGGRYRLAVGSLPAGASGTVTFAVTAATTVPTGTTQLSNRVDVADDGTNGPDPDTGDNTGTDTTPLALADLSLTKTTNNPAPAVGSSVAFTLTLSNAGTSAATGVRVRDALPAGVVFVSSSDPSYDPATGDDVWDVPTLAAGGSATLTVVGRVTAAGGGSVTNYAQVVGSGQYDPDSVPGNGTGPSPAEDDEAAATLTPVPVTVVKALAGTSVAATPGTSVAVGEEVTYALVVTVPCGSLTGITFVDTLPSGMALVPGSAAVDATGFGGTVGGLAVTGGPTGTVTFALGPVTSPVDADPTNNTFRIVYRAVVRNVPGNTGLGAAPTALTNAATFDVGDDGTGPTPANPVTVRVVEPRLTVTKAVVSPDGSVDAGAALAYRVVIAHAAGSTGPAFDVVLSDLLASVGLAVDLSSVDVTPTYTGGAPGYLSVTNTSDLAGLRLVFNRLDAGDTITVTYTAALTAGPAPGATVTNTAAVDYDTVPGVSPDDRPGPQVTSSAAVTVNTYIVSGVVYRDLNNNGTFEPRAGETLVAGPAITVTLTGFDHLGNAVSRTTQTTTGAYTFAGLRPSDASGYTVSQTTQPTGLLDGTDATGSFGGAANGADAVLGVVIPLNADQDGSANVGAGYDFGELPPASLAGFVWEDGNGDGVQGVSAAEAAGVDGITVTLTGTDDRGPITPRDTTTFGGGRYAFADLRPGTYAVTFGTAAGGRAYAFTIRDAAAATDATDNDADPAPGPAFGRTAPFGIGVGQATAGADAGVYLPVTIGDTVFYDLNGDGTRQPGEPGIPVAVVTLTGPGGQSFTGTIDAAGTYSITGLPPGSYVIAVSALPAGAATPTAGPTALTLASGGDRDDVDFGFRGVGTVGDRVFLDVDGNGAYDAGEGLVGVTVTLSGDLTGDGTPDILTTTTGADGFYRFTNLRAPAGGLPYRVTVGPAGLPRDGGGSPVANTADPDTAGTGDDTAQVTLTAATPTDAAQDFGYRGPGSVGERVFLDLNGSGAYDMGEGLAGVTVTLSGDVDGNGTTEVFTAVTDADGLYRFAGLLALDGAAQPVAYTVAVVGGLPAGVALSSDPDGGPLSSTFRLALTSAAIRTDANFGYRGAGALGDRVWVDADGDGLQGPTAREPGLPGVTLTLVWAGPDAAFGTDDDVTTATAAGRDGTYGFANLPPGRYRAAVDPASRPGNVTPTADRDDVPPLTAVADGVASVILADGQARSDVDFGFRGAASVGDLVFLDLNGNGAFDGADLGLPGAAVTLRWAGPDGQLGTPDDVLFATTTDAAGAYTFPGLPVYAASDPFRVVATPPVAGLTPTADVDDPPFLRAVDGAANLVVPATAARADADFGYAGAGQSLAGSVFNDLNGNGVRDAGEPGLPGAAVRLTGTDRLGRPVDLQVVTGADGRYAFPNLVPGTYTLAEVTQPTAYTDGLDSAGSLGGAAGNDVTTGIVVGAGSAGVGYDFGERGTTITGTVFRDDSRDGAQGPGEPGLPGVTLRLLDGAGAPVPDPATGTPYVLVTAADGSYRFGHLPAGAYRVVEAQPAGYGDGPVGPAAVIDLALPPTGTSGQLFPEVLGRLTGAAYLDANGNGTRDAGEPGLPGVAVTLAGTDVFGTPVLRTVTTGADGRYAFDLLFPANAAGYTLTEGPAGPYADGPANPAGTAGGSAAGPNTFTAIAPAAGRVGAGYDFGERPAVGLFGSVYQDVDNNGVRGAGEPGVAGAAVVLSGTAFAGTPFARPLTAADVPGGLTAVTDADGTWRFAAVPPGVYEVRQAGQPGGYIDGAERNGDTGATAVTVGEDVFAGVGLTPDAARGPLMFGELRPGAISGAVYLDANRNRTRDAGEQGIPGVTVTLTGTDDRGDLVSRTVSTGPDGAYAFGDLRPGVYGLTEAQPSGLRQGANAAGTGGGVVAGVDRFGTITMTAGGSVVGYLFGEANPLPVLPPVAPLPPLPPFSTPAVPADPGKRMFLGSTPGAGAAAAARTEAERTDPDYSALRSASADRLPTFAATAEGPGGELVRVFDLTAGRERFRFRPFPGHPGGVRVAVADLTGDEVPDVVAGAGPGGAPRVVVYDGATGGVVADFLAFEPTFAGGVLVAAADFDRDGRADLVVSPDVGGGPRVRVLGGGDPVRVLADFFGIEDPDFRGGVRAAAGDVNADGVADLVVAAGAGGGPRVAVWDGASVLAGTPARVVADFFAFESGLRNGVYPAAGDVDGDGAADVLAGAGPGGGPRVVGFAAVSLVAGQPAVGIDFFAGDAGDRGGVPLAAIDVDGDGRAEVFTGAGAGAAPVARLFDPRTGLVIDQFAAEWTGFLGGIDVG